jgi:hypothetical protein
MGAGDITIIITIIMAIMAMAQPRTSALTVMFQDNREIDYLLVLLLGQQEIFGSKVTVLVVIIVM